MTKWHPYISSDCQHRIYSAHQINTDKCVDPVCCDFTWTLDLTVSAGNVAVQKQQPATPPDRDRRHTPAHKQQRRRTQQ